METSKKTVFEFDLFRSGRFGCRHSGRQLIFVPKVPLDSNIAKCVLTTESEKILIPNQIDLL